MFRSHSNYIKGTPNSSYSWFKHIVLAIIWFALGVEVDQRLIQKPSSPSKSPLKPSTDVSLGAQATEQSSTAQNQLQDSEGKLVAVKRIDHQANQCRQKLEELHIELTDTKGRLELFDDATQMLSFLNSLRITEFELAELKHSYVLTAQNSKVCLLRQARKTIKAGDLVVSQGVLLGEITEVKHNCFDIISVENEQSSFEVVLEESGVRGIAVGLGSKSIKLKTNRLEEATIELKYLERATPAIIGERALLVRKHQAGDESHLSSPAFKLSPLTVGEVVEAKIDENGLFQSALLAPSLSQSSVSLVAIISASNSLHHNMKSKSK